MIKTWVERCGKFDDMHIVTNTDISRMMQQEIDELRSLKAAAHKALIAADCAVSMLSARISDNDKDSELDRVLSDYEFCRMLADE